MYLVINLDRRISGFTIGFDCLQIIAVASVFITLKSRLNHILQCLGFLRSLSDRHICSTTTQEQEDDERNGNSFDQLTHIPFLFLKYFINVDRCRCIVVDHPLLFAQQYLLQRVGHFCRIL
ncbi:hypothetical protein D1872_287700 [compost metagenome]